MKIYKYTVRDCLVRWIEGATSDITILRLKETVSEKWKPCKDGQLYYSVDKSGDVERGYFRPTNPICKFDIKTGNCFPYTKEGKKQAEEYREKLISLNK